MKSHHTVWTSSLLIFHLFLGTRGSFRRSMILLWLWISGFGLFPLCSPLSWFLDIWITPIWTNLSFSCIKDSTKVSREGIFQLGMESLLEWNVETNTEYSEPILLSTDNTSFSSFLSNPHCLHCSTSNLYFVKNFLIDSKLLSYKEIISFSNMCPWSSSCFP